MERAAKRNPSAIGYVPDPTDYTYLDRKFFHSAHRAFARAEAAVEEDAVRMRRVRHARLSLDRATIALWPLAADGAGGDFARVADRYRQTWAEQLELRGSQLERQEVLDEVEREIWYWSSRNAD